MFEIVGTGITNDNCIHKGIKRRLNSGNAMVRFCSKYFPFLASLEKFEYENIQNYNFTCCLMGVKLGPTVMEELVLWVF
jgi:hypothetical protein